MGPVVYTISRDPGDHLSAEDSMGKRLWGYSNHGELTIVVRPGLAEAVVRQTVVHELIHCALASVSGYRPDNEEELCLALEAGLYGVIRDNPDLVAWLTAPD